MEVLVPHLFRTDPSYNYAVEGVHWIVEFRDSDVIEIWFCVSWAHEVIQLTWSQITGAGTVYTPEEQRVWLERPDVRELRSCGQVWTEDKANPDDNGEFPPHFLLFDDRRGERVPDFPIEVSDKELLDMKEAAAVLDEKRRVFEKNSAQSVAEKIAPDALSFVDTALRSSYMDESFVSTPDEDRVRAADLESFASVTASAVLSVREMEERQRVHDANTMDFQTATIIKALENDFTDIMTKRMSDCVESCKSWRVVTTVNLPDESPLVARVKCKAVCESCSSQVSLVAVAGASFPYVVADGQAAFVALRQLANVNKLRLPVGNLTKHGGLCRKKQEPAASANIAPGAEGEQKRRKSASGVLSIAKIQTAIISQYGVFLFRSDPKMFQDEKYRLRHVSSAEQLVGNVMTRTVPSFLRLLRIRTLHNGTERLYFDASGEITHAVCQLKLFINAAQRSFEVVGGGDLIGFKSGSRSRAAKGEMAAAGTVAAHRLYLTRFLTFLCSGAPGGKMAAEVDVLLREAEQQQRSLNNSSIKHEKYLRAVQQTQGIARDVCSCAAYEKRCRVVSILRWRDSGAV